MATVEKRVIPLGEVAAALAMNMRQVKDVLRRHDVPRLVFTQKRQGVLASDYALLLRRVRKET